MLLVVGGQSRKVGKTSVVAGLIAALPEAQWTAVKITRHQHEQGPAEESESTQLVETGAGYVLRRQLVAENTDTGRYLAAGAKSAYLLETFDEGLAAAKPVLERLFAASANAIVESNSILERFEPDLFLAVADFTAPGLKESGRRHVARADAFVVTGSGPYARVWESLLAGDLGGKPRFEAPGGRVSRELVRFVAGRLRTTRRPSTRRTCS